MPEQGVTDAPELDGIDGCFSSLTISGDEGSPTNVKSRANSYNDEESDTNSDDGRRSRRSSRKELGCAENVDKFKRTNSQQTTSTESDSSEDGIEIESDSENEPIVSNVNKSDDLNVILKGFNDLAVTNNGNTESQRDVNSNKTPKNDVPADSKTINASNIPVPTENKKNDTDTQSDSENDDSVITRGTKHRGKPYDRKPEDSTVADLQRMAQVYSVIDANPRLVAELQDREQIEEPPNIVYAERPWATSNPVISIEDTDPEPMFSTPAGWNVVRPPLSSASSSITSEYNDLSPQSYVNEIDSLNGDNVIEGIDQLMNGEVLSPASSPMLSQTDFSDISQLDFALPDNLDLGNDYNEYSPAPSTSGIQESDHINLGAIQENDFISNIELETNNYFPFANNELNVPFVQEHVNTCHYGNCEQQTGTQQNRLSQISSSATPKENGLSYSQPINNVSQYQPAATVVQNSMPSTTVITTSHFPARGTVTITSGFNSRPVNEYEQNTIQFLQPRELVKTWSPSSSENDNNSNSSVESLNRLTNASPIQIPEPVERIEKISSSPDRKAEPWVLLGLPSEPASKRLQQHVTKDEALRAMSHMYKCTPKQLAEVDGAGDTPLMTFVSNPNYLETLLARIAPVLAKMETIPESLITKNNHRHDALYLAANNCPNHDYVTGVLAACIMKAHGGNHEVWRRTYNSFNDTLMHVIAAQGDNYTAILRELLAVRTPDNRCPFNISARNSAGKTPLHVAVESYDRVNNMNTVNFIRTLMKYGVDPTITENRNGDTALHMAISRKCDTEIIEALWYNGGIKAATISNYFGKTVIDLARAGLSDSEAGTRLKAIYRVMVETDNVNIYNIQSKTSSSTDRHPTGGKYSR